MRLLNLPHNVRYYLYNGNTDMRCTFNGLTGIIRGEFEQSPLSGDLFIFFNKKRDQTKLLVWDIDGYLIYHKRLEKGTFELPQFQQGNKQQIITAEQLQFILQGVVLNSVRHRKRYHHAV